MLQFLSQIRYKSYHLQGFKFFLATTLPQPTNSQQKKLIQVMYLSQMKCVHLQMTADPGGWYYIYVHVPPQNHKWLNIILVWEQLNISSHFSTFHGLLIYVDWQTATMRYISPKKHAIIPSKFSVSNIWKCCHCMLTSTSELAKCFYLQFSSWS